MKTLKATANPTPSAAPGSMAALYSKRTTIAGAAAWYRDYYGMNVEESFTLARQFWNEQAHQLQTNWLPNFCKYVENRHRYLMR